MDDFGKGKKIDPPQKWCNKEVIFKTNENEWTVFRNDKKRLLIYDYLIKNIKYATYYCDNKEIDNYKGKEE